MVTEKQKTIDNKDISEKELKHYKDKHKELKSNKKHQDYISNEEKLSGNKGGKRRYFPGLKNV